MYSSWLHRCAVALAACTFALLIAGTLITAKPGSATFRHAYEITATVAAVLMVVIWSSGNSGFVNRLAIGSFALVLLHWILRWLVEPTSKAGAAGQSFLAHLLFAGTVALAVAASQSWREGPEIVEDSGWPSLRSMAVICGVIVPVQIVLGAALRFGILTAVPHVIGSIVVTAVIVMVSIFVLAQFGSHVVLRRSAMALLAITCAQVILGILAFLGRLNSLDAPASLQTMLLTTAHVANGALTFAASIVLAIQVLRNVQPRLSQSPAHLSPVSR